MIFGDYPNFRKPSFGGLIMGWSSFPATSWHGHRFWGEVRATSRWRPDDGQPSCHQASAKVSEATKTMDFYSDPIEWKTPKVRQTGAWEMVENRIDTWLLTLGDVRKSLEHVWTCCLMVNSYWDFFHLTAVPFHGFFFSCRRQKRCLQGKVGASFVRHWPGFAAIKSYKI